MTHSGEPGFWLHTCRSLKITVHTANCRQRRATARSSGADGRAQGGGIWTGTLTRAQVAGLLQRPDIQLCRTCNPQTSLGLPPQAPPPRVTTNLQLDLVKSERLARHRDFELRHRRSLAGD
jgi:hypothetical protein